MPPSLVDDDPQRRRRGARRRRGSTPSRSTSGATTSVTASTTPILVTSCRAAGAPSTGARSEHGSGPRRKGVGPSPRQVSDARSLEREVYQAGPAADPCRAAAGTAAGARLGAVSRRGRPAPRPRGRRGRRGRCRRGCWRQRTVRPDARPAAASPSSPTQPPRQAGEARPGRPRSPRRRRRPRPCGRRGSARGLGQQRGLGGVERGADRADAAAPSVVWTLLRSSRRTSVTSPWARSRGPTSTRTGTPFSSQSVTRRPKLVADPVVEAGPHAGGRQLVARCGRPRRPRPRRRAPRRRPPGRGRPPAAPAGRRRRRGP